ncbi:MAG: zinc ribbon domain-containing protein [Candidatus Hadarchaeaceae archaeon]
MASKRCPNCGYENSAVAKFCMRSAQPSTRKQYSNLTSKSKENELLPVWWRSSLREHQCNSEAAPKRNRARSADYLSWTTDCQRIPRKGHGRYLEWEE